MRNEQIRNAIKTSGVKMWEVAEKLSISDGNFSRKFRKEFSEKEKGQIYTIINEIKIEKGLLKVNEPKSIKW